MRRLMLVALTAALTPACAGPSTPVPVAGASADVALLAGRWVGDFSSVETGRSGSIQFRLSATADSAFGDVFLNPTDMFQRIPTRDPGAAAAPPSASVPAAPQWIQISFVRVAGGRVSGTLRPYTDPTCGCPLYTSFEGGLAGDTLSGTYTSRHEGGGAIQKGRWTVLRQRP
jgi:hypothetical protein